MIAFFINSDDKLDIQLIALNNGNSGASDFAKNKENNW